MSKHVHTDRDVVHHDISRLGFFEIPFAVNSCSLLYFPIENRHALLIHGLVESVLQSDKRVTENKPSSCIGQPIPTLINMPLNQC